VDIEVGINIQFIQEGENEMEHLPEVKAVWRRWEPRFIGAGVDFNTLLKLKAEIKDWTEWCQKWSERGADLEKFGDEAMERGHTLTAAESWSSAAVLFQFAGMYYINDMDQFYESHERKLKAFTKAAPYLNPQVERFEVPFKGATLACYLRLPTNGTKPPVVLFSNGFEGVKEESFQRTKRYLDRGMATITWDGPGRGEAWQDLPMSGDNGPPTAAIIDYLETRNDVDADRVGVSGPNRGGFAAVKAAAYDSRIKACGVASPGYDRRSVKWDDPYEIAFMLHLFHLNTEEELRERMMEQTDFTLEGEADKIRCPLLVVVGGKDEGTQYQGSLRLYEEAQGPKELVIIPDAERNGNNVPFKVRPRIADFMADQLSVRSGS
jgi:dipeptidyl aminopeptidase/acylaminoacyl peptidase